MYNSNYRHLVTKERYEKLAGADWPSYEDYLAFKESSDPDIMDEMKDVLSKEINNWYNDYQRHRLRNLKRFIFDGPMYHVWRAFIPGIIGLILFFYLGGTLTKFLIIALIGFICNFIYGVSLHRWLTHKQFEPKPWARPFLLFLVTLAGFGHVLVWTGVHLIHHKHSDQDSDPHPVKNGFMRTMLMVTNLDHAMLNDPVFRRKFDKDITFVIKHFWKLHCLSLLVIALIDFDLFLLSFLLIKSVVVLQNGYINYFGHTGKNNPAVKNISNKIAVFINGENWHKNHHNDTKKFNQADEKRIDFGYYVVKLFAKK